MARQLFLVAYDVRNPKRLRQALYILKDYASGGQKSAFECYLSAGEQRELIDRMADILNLDMDAFVIARMSSRECAGLLGKAVQPVDELYAYIG